MRPGDAEIAKQLARLHHRLGNALEAKDTLQTHLHNYPTAVDLELINILAELYMNAEEWSLAVDNIQYANTQLCGSTGLPIDLQVRILHDIKPVLMVMTLYPPLPLRFTAQIWHAVIMLYLDHASVFQHAHEAHSVIVFTTR